MYAKVIVDIANENTDKLFTYALTVNAHVGQRVLVPFGKGNKCIEGFIIEITDAAENGDFNIKEIIRTVEDYCAIDETQIKLCEWISKTYHCTMAQALRLMIPAQLRGMRVKEKNMRCVRIASEADPILYLETLKTKAGKIRSQGAYDTVTLLMQSDTWISVQDLYAILPRCNSSTVKKLIDCGILCESQQTVFRRPTSYCEKTAAVPTLTDEQQNAFLAIKDSVSNKSGVYLLHGVTGSGKTEVYMRAIEHVIECNKTAIVLVPEISLTPQTVGRFTQRFGDGVAVLHSRLSAGERFDEWRRIRLGTVKVVVGARSAVFAPLSNIGIIIIDEEHESSYSSESIPRYNAIEVAKKRCDISGATLVLGSATPSVTTYFRAVNGKYTLLELKKRINKQPLPEVEVTDMRTEFLRGNNGIFSENLKMALSECVRQGEQAILFLNRRGYSNFVTCRACGHIFNCVDCDVSMTYHKYDNRMRCHYCGAEKAVPTVCPKCNRTYIKYSGIGTQQIEEEVTKLFPNVKTVRMDADTTRGKDAHIRLLSEFSNGNAGILIGTQMIAKGLDFPNVTLVGIVSVDAMLAMPDFRNTERTFQLLTQVAGRAGRAGKSGKVILQTNNPSHPIIGFAKTHDYKAFYEYAITNRLENMYPPYSVFVRILFAGDDDAKVHEYSVKYVKKLYDEMIAVLKAQNANLSEILFMYAMPAPIKRIQNKHRHHILMKLARTKNTAKLIDCIYAFSQNCDIPYLSAIEVNPNDML